jgi:PAS domain S-box-containing protein
VPTNDATHAEIEGRDEGFEALFRFSPLAIIISSDDGHVVDVNQATVRLLGFEREEMLGRTSAGLGLYDAEVRARNFETLRTQGYLRDVELKIKVKSGDVHHVITCVERIEMSGKLRYVTTFLDITPRRQMEDQLRSAEERFRLLVQSVKDYAIYMLDPEGLVQTWNAGAAKIKGYADAEILGRSFSVFFTSEDRERDKPGSLLKAAASSGQTEDVGWRIRKDGSRFWANVILTAIRDANGQLRGFAKVTRDLTEREAAQARLVLADRMSSVGTLAAGVAHEINNPLAYVAANLDMIAEELRGLAGGLPSARLKELEEMTNEAREGAERVRKIVRGLKTFSRAEEERRVTLDVRQVLDLSINMAFNEIRHRARLVKDYGETPLIEADEARLGQVFINLLVNAAQAMAEGHVEQNEIRIVTQTNHAGHVVVQVRDTGRGIPQETLARIFDPFFTTKPIGEGTGLGLSICHNIVTALGGEITAESQIGKGTVFQVVIPPARLEPQPGQEVKRAQSMGPTPAVRWGRVLVVDDDAMVGKVLRRILGTDHDVTVVPDGKDALDLLISGKSFDVIICDLMMPSMTGMELHEELSRASPEIVDRMVFVTGGAFTPAARAFLDTVPNQRFEKPFAPQNLRALVRGFVR